MKLKEFGSNYYAAVDAAKVEGIYVQRQRFPTMRVVDSDYHKTFLESGRVIAQTATGTNMSPDTPGLIATGFTRTTPK